MPRLLPKIFLSCLAAFLTLPLCVAQSIVVGRLLPLLGQQCAGSNPTPTSLINGLESLKDHDLGGFFIGYSPTAHIGSTFVEINVVNANGELIR